MQTTLTQLAWGRPRRLPDSGAGPVRTSLRGSNHRATRGPARMLPAAQYPLRTPSHPPFHHSHSPPPSAPLATHPFPQSDTHALHRHHNKPASCVLAQRRPRSRWASFTPGHSPLSLHRLSLSSAPSPRDGGERARSLLLLLVVADARQSCCQLLARTAIVGPRYIGTPIWRQRLSPCYTC